MVHYAASLRVDLKKPILLNSVLETKKSISPREQRIAVHEWSWAAWSFRVHPHVIMRGVCRCKRGGQLAIYLLSVRPDGSCMTGRNKVDDRWGQWPSYMCFISTSNTWYLYFPTRFGLRRSNPAPYQNILDSRPNALHVATCHNWDVRLQYVLLSTVDRTSGGKSNKIFLRNFAEYHDGHELFSEWGSDDVGALVVRFG